MGAIYIGQAGMAKRYQYGNVFHIVNIKKLLSQLPPVIGVFAPLLLPLLSVCLWFIKFSTIMEILIIDSDQPVFGRRVAGFPLGIGAAFEQLMQMVPGGDKRSCYGISSMDEKGGIVYLAAIAGQEPDEAEKYQCERYTIHKGEYLAVTVLDWLQKTHCINNVFHEMMQDDRFARDTPCVEWYKNDKEMICLLQVNPAKALLHKINDTVNALKDLFATLAIHQINDIPFAGSWTAAQLLTHVTRSISAMAQAMEMPGKPANRDPAARVQELKDMFLDFSVKYVSPSFIVPENKMYKKEAVLADLENCHQQLIQNAAGATVAAIISLPAFGEITKMELLHFVLYHTQRHIRQLKNILQELQAAM
jgi:predicted transcriptional regulator YdeE